VNTQDYEILKYIMINKYMSQRNISDNLGISLGSVNKSIKKLISNGYIDSNLSISENALTVIKSKCPRNAIILAAGYGMRMVPINTETPKGLLEIKGEVLIERIIRQLHEIGIHEIHVVVGFMKEQYEYLIDEFGVNLIINSDYSSSNNLHSLNLAAKYISNTYIIPCDIWCENNPFNIYELYSWYMVTDITGKNSNVKINRKKELVRLKNSESGNRMIGIAYLTGNCSEYVKSQLQILDQDYKHINSFWEEALFLNNKMLTWAKLENNTKVFEIDTYEQLRELDNNSNSLNTNALKIITDVFCVDKKNIKNVAVLKKGMTNRSFTFQVNNKKYIMRIPGEGTDKIINRKNEFNVYNMIKNKDICEKIIYINPYNGYKITEYINNTRVCDTNNNSDLIICMNKLKKFHNMQLKVEHSFNLFDQINYYEALWDGKPSVYRDYKKTKNNIFQLKEFIEKHKERDSLTHIDAVPDNFLIVDKNNQESDIYLIDWEYAAMQDPHVDIAMFCIYALYSKEEIDNLINIYFDNMCPRNVRIKIYCYIAICGLLWSNWCEYKQHLGIEFGEYSLKQYRYAKEYFKIAINEIETLGEYKCIM